MKGVYFVSGIDTDIGKTVATGMLAKQLLQQGKSVITQSRANRLPRHRRGHRRPS